MREGEGIFVAHKRVILRALSHRREWEMPPNRNWSSSRRKCSWTPLPLRTAAKT